MLAVLIGLVSAVGGATGAVIGNKVNVTWLKERIAEHTARLTANETMIQRHELQLALMHQRRHDDVGNPDPVRPG
ncbi:MAG: hypothetical protein R3303_05640 [Marinobacter sp.]|nr:hypothetical protein [Marinobacter sp.]